MDVDISQVFFSNALLLGSIPILLLFSAFFSASEVAFFSLNRRQIAEKATTDTDLEMLQTLLAAPKRLLTTVLIGNTLANVALAIVGITLVEKLIPIYDWSRPLAIGAEIVATTLLILVFGEIAPKTMVVKHAERFVRGASRTVGIFQILLYPLVEGALQFSRLLEKILIEIKMKWRGAKELSDEEIQVITEVGLERAQLEKTEKQLIDNVLDFRQKPVRKVMTPRTDIEAIEIDTPIQEAIERVMRTQRSRLPLYEESLDNILGVVYAKDLVKFMHSRKKFDKEQWLKIARQPIFVPETQHLDDVLREFQRSRMHLAIVVDEYGGTAGIATLEDVIAEIVGELSPTPKIEEPLHKTFNDGSHWFDASIPLEDATEYLGKPVEFFQTSDEENFDTLGGFILHFTGEIPDEKQRVRYGDLEFEIEKIDGNRIASLWARPIKVEKSNA